MGEETAPGFCSSQKVENPGARAHLVEEIIIVAPFGSGVFEKNPAENHSEHIQRVSKSQKGSCLCLHTCWFSSTAGRALLGRRPACNSSSVFRGGPATW